MRWSEGCSAGCTTGAMMAGMVRMCLVGCGNIARLHVRGMLELDSVSVTVLVDKDLKRCEEFAAIDPVLASARHFASLEDAVENARELFDAVDIMLPFMITEEVVTYALQQGLHVLQEKPLSTSLEGCKRLLQEGKKSDRVFMVAENAQYWSEVVLVQKLLREGAIGELLTITGQCIETTYHGENGGDFLDDYIEGSWRAQSKGFLMDTGSHYIRPMRMWGGEISSVCTVMNRKALPHMKGDSLSHSLIRFENGLVGYLNAYVVAGPITEVYTPFFVLQGTKGQMVIHGTLEDNKVTLYNEEHPSGRVYHDPDGSFTRSYKPEIEAFANACLGRPSELGTPENGMMDVAVVLAMYESGKGGGFVDVCLETE